MKVLVTLAVLAVFGVLAYWFGGDQVTRRALQRVPRKRIGDLRDGEEARVIGVVGVEAPIRAPISGRRCAYYRVVVEEQYESSGRRSWRDVLDEQDGVDFLVKDETGEALVKTTRVEAVLEKDRSKSSGFLRDATPELEAFLKKHGRSSEGLVFNRTLRYREGVVEAGERVAVAGLVRRKTPEARPVLAAPPNGSLLISDETDLTSAS